MTDQNKHNVSELEAEMEAATVIDVLSPEPASEDIPLLVGELHMLLSRMNLAIAKLPRGKLKADSMRHVSICMDWAEYLDKDFSPPRILPEDQDSE